MFAAVQLFCSSLLFVLATADQYIITIGPGEEAKVYCYSTVERTTWNTSCEDISGEAEHKMYFICMTTVRYSQKTQRRTCQLKANNNLTLPLLILPRKLPSNETVDANSTNMRCIVEQDKSELQAGHLLSASFTIIPNATKSSGGKGSGGKGGGGGKYVAHKTAISNNFSLVQQHPIWEMNVGQTFTCNGTKFVLKVVFQCLQILPSGWPSFTNCKIFHKIGITIGVIVAFVIAYVILCVGLCQVLSLCKSKKVMKT